IWPLTQHIRDAVVARLIETLSKQSILSKRYGTLPSDKASFATRLIEMEAFSIAAAFASAEDDEIKILQVYSHKISLFSIWPLTQHIRDAVVARLIETLSKQSILSKRYGTLPSDKASFATRLIEMEAFSIAAAFASAEDDEIKILQVYSHKISRRMLDTIKTHASSAAASFVVDTGTAL
ncbi:mfp1 attachment factor 1, partial [Quercus suber]